jgi:protein TonB
VIEQPRPTPAPPPPDPPVVFDDPSPMSFEAPPPAPPAPPAPPTDYAASENPSYRRNNPPRYPPAAARRGIEGEVVLRVTVGPDGSPIDIQVHRSSRNRDLDRAAIDAVRRWMFNPRRVNGEPVQGEVLVPIAFSMN